MTSSETVVDATWQVARIYAGDDGESHFEDIDMIGPGEAVWSSASSAVASALIAASGVTFRTVLGELDEPQWRNPPCSLLIVQLTGTVEIEVSDGETRTFGPASVLFVEDLAGQGHITRKVGEGPRMAMYVYTDQTTGSEVIRQP